MKQHPLSAAFPSMGADDFQALKDSIDVIGVQNPITVFEGMVIDGWHRYTAANELGMDCPVVELGDVDPVQFVRAQNKNRRHLPLGAWALIEVSLSEWRPAGQKKKAELSSGLTRTTQEMADAVGVTDRTIRQAKTVHATATAEVVDAVKRGEIGLPKAAAIAKLPKAEQAAAIHKPAPKVESEPAPEDDGPSAEELAAHAAAEAADRELMAKLLDSNEPLAELAQEIKQLKAENAQLKQRVNGLMSEKNEAIALVKARDRQIAKLEKLLKAEA